MKTAGLLAVLSLLAGPSLAANPAPPSISIRPSLAPEERARRAAEDQRRREILLQDLAAWRSRHEPLVQPLRRAVEEAVSSLRVAWGPYSHNLGYAVKLEVERLRAHPLPPLPDPALQAGWESALADLEEGADLCLQRRPTMAQMRLAAGWQKLVGSIAGVETPYEPHRLFVKPPCGPGCAGTTRPGGRIVPGKPGPSSSGRARSRPPLKVPKYPTLRRRP